MDEFKEAFNSAINEVIIYVDTVLVFIIIIFVMYLNSEISDIKETLKKQQTINAELHQLLTDGLQETRSRLSIELHCQFGDRGACDILEDRTE